MYSYLFYKDLHKSHGKELVWQDVSALKKKGVRNSFGLSADCERPMTDMVPHPHEVDQLLTV